MKFAELIFWCVFMFLIAKASESQNTDDENLYILHTKNGDIMCNYHNSRDLNNGWLEYYDYATKSQKLIEGWKVDSVTVLSEDRMTRGPRNKKLKYIDKRSSNN